MNLDGISFPFCSFFFFSEHYSPLVTKSLPLSLSQITAASGVNWEERPYWRDGDIWGDT